MLRPKGDGRQAHFYSLVTRDSVEQEFAQKRRLFLTEQGYRYEILDEPELLLLLSAEEQAVADAGPSQPPPPASASA